MLVRKPRRPRMTHSCGEKVGGCTTRLLPLLLSPLPCFASLPFPATTQPLEGASPLAVPSSFSLACSAPPMPMPLLGSYTPVLRAMPVRWPKRSRVIRCRVGSILATQGASSIAASPLVGLCDGTLPAVTASSHHACPSTSRTPFIMRCTTKGGMPLPSPSLGAKSLLALSSCFAWRVGLCCAFSGSLANSCGFLRSRIAPTCSSSSRRADTPTDSNWKGGCISSTRQVSTWSSHIDTIR
mmetsp:Transcript_3353/g.10478  ORF Transcript_3353/g.10478 Transcript_3353/m.10478 type:complete len:240 (+) Transcript_3353:670-1389(+)